MRHGLRATCVLTIYDAVSATAVARVARELAFRSPPTVEMTEEVILGGGNFQQAVNDQVEPQISVIDDRLSELEEENRALLETQNEFSEELQQLRKDNEVLSTNHAAVINRLEALEKLVSDLCAAHDICL